MGSFCPKYVLDFINLMRELGSGKTPGRGTRYNRMLTRDLGLRPNKELNLVEVLLNSSQYQKLENALRGCDVGAP
jgi:hypothetical protein